MKILLVDVDGKLPNLALMKISTWHKAMGDKVYLNSCVKPDKVYVSTLFTWSRPKVEKILAVYPHAEVGGHGWDKLKKLPPEIDSCKPDYDLYTVTDILPRIAGGIATKASKQAKAEEIVNAGIGYTSRGCVRECGFCSIPSMEGRFRQTGQISELINPKSKVIILLDNNLTADPDVIDKLHKIRDRGLMVDITQGIDVRLITPEIAQALSEVKHLRSIHYAWDLMAFENQILQGINILSESVKKWRHMCFMLTGYNTTFEEDMYRFNRLTEIGIKPYVMPYNKKYKTERDHCFAGWVNSRKHTVCTFEEYEPWIKARSEVQLSMF